MTSNHFAFAFALDMPGWLTIALFSLGGLTFPIMAFLLTEGYRHTSNVRRYATRLLVFAFISQIPYSTMWVTTPNVMFSLLAGLVILYANDHMKSRGAFAALLAAVLAVSIPFDWGFTGPLMVYLFHILKDQGARGVALTMLVPFASNIAAALEGFFVFWEMGGPASSAGIEQLMLTSSAATAYSSSAVNQIVQEAVSQTELIGFLGDSFSLANPLIQGCSMLGYAVLGFSASILLIMGYRGRRGKPMKWLFYAYYPVHIAMIALLRIIL